MEYSAAEGDVTIVTYMVCAPTYGAVVFWAVFFLLLWWVF